MARDRIRLSALGDSITAGNPGWDPDPERRPFEGDDPESQYLFWAARADPRIEFRNHGVGGETTAEIVRRFEDAAADADVLVVQGGINDVVHDLDLDEAAANLRGLVRRARERGLGVVVPDVLPWNKGWPDADPKIRRLNELIAQLGAEEDVVVLPFYETLEDPERPGRMREDWTPDGNHPSVAGHRRLGEVAFRLPPGFAP
ncbi:MAG TPA: SGNH/GDSL hydrolase family protein [Gaiellaceae bacterium]|jgi:lysophospholipase L1-like esterase|nr:SGNH/GDSL hydrolase family protein [Gaiellaceae bacterium]